MSDGRTTEPDIPDEEWDALLAETLEEDDELLERLAAD